MSRVITSATQRGTLSASLPGIGEQWTFGFETSFTFASSTPVGWESTCKFRIDPSHPKGNIGFFARYFNATICRCYETSIQAQAAKARKILAYKRCRCGRSRLWNILFRTERMFHAILVSRYAFLFLDLVSWICTFIPRLLFV